ncbi:unnamed protein product [Heligmosomoides polygyrus]|uniref:Non-specific serine/threonine protein kinase n=1 Tax=Heligmosomoides polygyrus TaxID=6339 RepID=A0A183FKH0_HELPZ|nr:unnamed protein product [Heligmosomoides polygyrus]
MGKPRLIKVVVPSKYYWRKALSSARHLCGMGHADVFVRGSMIAEERKRKYELRQQDNEKNKGKATREWVVFCGQLRQVFDLTSGSFGNV